MLSLSTKIKKIMDYQGLMAAPFTAFNEAGDLMVDGIPKYEKYLRDNGIRGIYVNGTTGEWLSMNVQERKQTTEEWIKVARESMDLIVIHVTANRMKDTLDLARHAEENNADAIALLPPIYYKPDNNAQLISYMKEVSSVIPNTPILYYHNPGRTGVTLNLNDFIAEAKPIVPNFVAAKYATPDLKDMAYCQANHGHHFKVMSAIDELWVASLALGLNASIGSSHGILPKLNNDITKAFNENNVQKAWEAQMKLNDVIDRITKIGNRFAALKAFMNLTTPINVGCIRMPMSPLSEEQLNNLKKEITLMNL